MKRLIICTGGTSIGPTAFKERVIYVPSDTFRLRVRERLRTLRSTSPETFNSDASAELNVLGKLDCSSRDDVLVLATDTEDGVACAEMLVETAIKEFGCRADFKSVGGLQVKDARAFRQSGIRNLFKAMDDALTDAERRGLKPLININGGFKSILPLVALYGTLRGIPCHYGYEQSQALITLPPLPLTFDWGRLGFAAEALSALRDRGPLPEREFRSLLPQHGYGDDPVFLMLIEQEGDLVSPSLSGFLMFERLSAEVARGRVEYSPKSLRIIEGNTAPSLPDALDRIIDPLERNRPGHCERYNGKTDLRIWKVTEDSALRVFYEVDGDVVRVFDVLTHDEYDRRLKNGPGLWRDDFDGVTFHLL
jgi:putative CRISPR-associated protein (TIGR02619 family)